MVASALASLSFRSSYVSAATDFTVAAAEVVAVCAVEIADWTIVSGSVLITWASGSETVILLGWVAVSFGEEYAGGGASGVASTCVKDC